MYIITVPYSNWDHTLTQAIYPGFILSREQYTAKPYHEGGSISVCYWLSSDVGPIKVTIANQQAVFFIRQSAKAAAQQLLISQNIQVEFKNTTMHHFDGELCIGCYFSTISAFYKAKAAFDNQLAVYEVDIRHCDRFLMERFIRGGVWVKGDVSRKQGYIQIDNAQLKANPNYTPNLKSLSLDIECSGDGVLFSVALVGAGLDCILMIGEPEPSELEIYWCEDEIDLLNKLQVKIMQSDPDIIIGWNVIEFDFTVLHGRAEALGIDINIGRAGEPLKVKEGHFTRLSIPGRTVIDGIDTLKNATYHFDSFSLANVSHKVLGEKKLIQSDNRLDEIIRQFNEDKLALSAYNRQDCVLVNNIFEKLKLSEFAIVRSQLTGLELERMGGSVAAFTNLYLPLLHRSGYVAPNLGEHGLSFESPGGYVMESVPGLYKNVLVLDFKSLYPSIMRTFCIDPLGLIRGLAESGKENTISGFKGGRFSRKEHHLPNLIKELTSARQTAKDTHQPMLSQAIKIIMNSLYGVLGSKGCRFYDPRLASSITLRGHDIMQTTKKWIEELGYQVIYGDTDSTFVCLDEKMTDSECQKTGHELAEMINLKWQQSISVEHALPSHLEIEFETHYTTFFMPTIRGKSTGSKKRYVGQTNINGQKKLIFKGMETVRSDWTKLAQQFQVALFEALFNDEFEQQDIENIIKNYTRELLAGELDELLIYRKRLGQHLTEYQKNIPPHVQAAKKYQRENPEYQPERGQFIEFIYTKQGCEIFDTTKNYSFDYPTYLKKQLQPLIEMIVDNLAIDIASGDDSQLNLF